MRSFATFSLLFLLGSAAFAQDSRPASQPVAKPKAEGEIELREAKSTVIKRLPKLDSPVVFSRDGSSILYVLDGKGDQPNVYVRANADGEDAVELFTTPVGWDDMFACFMGPGSFSADGKRVLVLTTEGGKRFRDGDPLRALVLDEQGNQTKLPAPNGCCLGFGFVGSQVLTLDGANFRQKRVPGYSLRSWKGIEPTELVSSKEHMAIGLRVSPDQTKVAYFVVTRREGCVEVYDLNAKTTTRSEFFRSDDVTWDGPPIMAWDHESKGVYVHVVRSKKDFDLSRFDLKTKKMEVVAKNLGLCYPLDGGRLAVVQPWDKAGIFRLKDRTFHVIPDGYFIAGGHGKRLAVVSKDQQQPDLADVEMSE